MVHKRSIVVLFALSLVVFAPQAQAWTKHMVPIKGVMGTHGDFVDPSQAPPASACPVGPTGILLGWVHLQGTGVLSYLGLTVVDTYQCVWLDLATGTQMINGEVLYQAVNGDTIQATYDGEVSPIDPAHITFRGVMTFVGGTGCFAGATGWAPYSGGYSFATKVGFFQFKGKITPVRRCLNQ